MCHNQNIDIGWLKRFISSKSNLERKKMCFLCKNFHGREQLKCNDNKQSKLSLKIKRASKLNSMAAY